MLSAVKRFSMLGLAVIMVITAFWTYSTPVSAEALDSVSFAYVETYEIKTKEKINTDDAYINAERWGHVSPISDLIETNGCYTVVFSDTQNVYIKRFKHDMTLEDTLTIKKLYPLFGGIINDSNNYYIAWGQNDDKGNGGIATVAISKYDHMGNLSKTTEYVTDTRDTGTWNEYLTYKGGWATRYPFDAGNCAMTLQNGVLVCFIGREMYNGHQSSAVYAVNTADLSKNYDYFTYSSHSFNQRVISLSDGGVLFCDHGDAYPRAFKLSKSDNEEYESFHFVDPAGCCNNDTYAELGGICELESGYVLVGSSIKGEDKSAKKQLFMQVINKGLTHTISSGKSRTIKVNSHNLTDTGIIWLTDYTDASARNINVCKTSPDCFIIMWEKHDSTGYIESFYTILNEKDAVIKPTTSLGTRVNGSEELKYKNGYVFWATANDTNTISVHRMRIDSEIKITYKATNVYKGKSIKPSISVAIDGKQLNKNTDYSSMYSNADSIGIATITVTGKNRYKDWKCSVNYNIVFDKPKLRGRKISNSKLELYWDALPCPYHKEALITKRNNNSLSYTYRSYSHPGEYEIYISTNGGSYVKLSSVDGTKISCTISQLDLNNNTYRFKIRAKINGDKFDYDWNARKWVTSVMYSSYSNVLKA